MTNFCTVCDSNYVLKGMAMYDSLVKHYGANNFILLWLCMDKALYDLLSLQVSFGNKSNIQIYLLSDFEQEFTELQIMKSNPATLYGDSYSNYCWSLTPWFINYILSHPAKLNHGELLIYCDADIWFMASPQIIIEAVGNKSVGIHTHRFTGPFHEIEVGWYNVGVVVFKKDADGLKVAKQWKDWLVDTGNPYYKSHGKTGDQKYLELFEQIAPGNVAIFDENTQISHLAPWCAEIENGKSVVFFHFSHFVFDIPGNTWSDSIKGEWNPSKNPEIKKYYQGYFDAIFSAAVNLEHKVSIIGNIRVDGRNPDRVKYLMACLKSFEFLKDNCEIILNIECPHPSLRLLHSYFQEQGFDYKLYLTDSVNNYGDAYNFLLSQAKYGFVLNFIEDHFCEMDSSSYFKTILNVMYNYKIDLVKASFFEVEKNSILAIDDVKLSPTGKYFLNNEFNFEKYCEYYNFRYYIGVNFITTKDFAKKFWSRKFNSTRPHEWEIINYDPNFEHTAMVPDVNILSAIDDNHGEPKTCMIEKGNSKWKSCNFIK